MMPHKFLVHLLVCLFHCGAEVGEGGKGAEELGHLNWVCHRSEGIKRVGWALQSKRCVVVWSSVEHSGQLDVGAALMRA